MNRIIATPEILVRDFTRIPSFIYKHLYWKLFFLLFVKIYIIFGLFITMKRVVERSTYPKVPLLFNLFILPYQNMIIDSMSIFTLSSQFWVIRSIKFYRLWIQNCKNFPCIYNIVSNKSNTLGKIRSSHHYILLHHHMKLFDTISHFFNQQNFRTIINSHRHNNNNSRTHNPFIHLLKLLSQKKR